MYRAIVIGPVACGVIGGTAGVCLAMLYRQEPLERVHVYLDDSLPLLVGGVVLGCLAGLCVFVVCTRWPGALPGLMVFITTLLGAGILAPLGWIAGDLGAERLPGAGMSWGAAIGALGGLAAGTVQLLIDRHSHRPAAGVGDRQKSEAEPNAPADRPRD